MYNQVKKLEIKFDAVKPCFYHPWFSVVLEIPTRSTSRPSVLSFVINEIVRRKLSVLSVSSDAEMIEDRLLLILIEGCIFFKSK